jgi:hypothetical protein
MHALSNTNIHADSGTGGVIYLETNEVLISEVAQPFEWLELGQAPLIWFNANKQGGLSPHISFFSDSGSGYLMVGGFNLSLIEVVYASGSPTGVRFLCSYFTFNGTSGAITYGQSDVTLTINNTYQVIQDDGVGFKLEGNCRPATGQVYLKLKATFVYSSGVIAIHVPINRRVFKSKA